VEFCLNNSYVIGGTIFPHKDVHKLTWRFPDRRTVNQIDHVVINSKWRRSLRDVRVYRGADANSDHYMVAATIKLKLRQAQKQKQTRQMLDITKLKSPEVKREFTLELRNRFRALANTSESDDVDDDQESLEEKWDNIKKAYTESAKTVIGPRKRNNKEWLTPETWTKIRERKELKVKMLNTKSARLLEQLESAYKTKDKEVKKSARHHKSGYIDEMAQEAEQAAARGELSTVYKNTKRLCGGRINQSTPVKDKDGNRVTTDQEQAERWAQHFYDVLNQPDPDLPANPPAAENDLDIDIQPPTEDEVKRALKTLKNGKAPGIDCIHAEMLKADVNTAIRVLTDLIHTIWHNDTIPEDWCKGLIVKLPKKETCRTGVG
jgi:hypothetical protein